MALCSATSLVFIIDLSLKSASRLDFHETFPKDRIIWCDWLKSKSSSVLCLLDLSGNFLVFESKSNRLLKKIKIKSPEDFTLKCKCAAIDGTMVWIGMENGDVFLLNPLSASNSLVDKSSPSPFHAEEDYGSRQTKEPLHGPFLMIPEPIDISTNFILPFSVEGLKILAVFNDNGNIYLFLPVHKSGLQSLTNGADNNMNALTLTLIEKLATQSMSQLKGAFFVRNKGLVCFGRKNVFLISFPWVSHLKTLLSKPNFSANSQDITISSRLVEIHSQSDPIDFVTMVKRDIAISTSGQVEFLKIPECRPPLTSSQTLRKEAQTLTTPSITSSLFNISLLKYSSSTELKNKCFPMDLDEESLVYIINHLDKIKADTLSRLRKIAEEYRCKIQAHNEFQQKQREWAAELFARFKQISSSLPSSLSSLNDHACRLGTLSANVNFLTDADLANIQRHLSDISGNLLEIHNAIKNSECLNADVNSKVEEYKTLFNTLQEKLNLLSIEN